MIGTNGADWRTAHPGCALQTFDSKSEGQSKLDLTWLQVLQKTPPLWHRKLHQLGCHFSISDDAFGKLCNNHSNFFLGAHWVEERLAEEKRIDNTHKQAETFGRTQGLAHDWDKWSRLENSSSRLCLADF
ncbi:hypothetical protein PoB_005436700 [Plakobranchus ocellatus]|uniref:Uncharacterized protein n=1 Tax=Plakobranchus ocellatus TaxID=259542 RepID=A0AAV4C929_9GAST|nr:hypothetical protein PoB_005436700 [Plakobranchus ocellatus]